jgi:hypothetical protein
MVRLLLVIKNYRKTQDVLMAMIDFRKLPEIRSSHLGFNDSGIAPET